MENQEKIPVRIRMYSERYEVSASLFDIMLRSALDPRSQIDMGEEPPTPASPEEELLMGILEDEDSESGLFVKPLSAETLKAILNDKDPDPDDGIDRMELISEGYLTRTPTPDGDETLVLTYDETEITGMEGAHSTITFRTGEPDLLHLVRSGSVTTALTFKPHHRAICVYQTPYMPFQVAIHCLGMKNNLHMNGEVTLDYIIEIRGAQAERCRMILQIL